MSWKNSYNWLGIDCETTGPKIDDRIVELGMCRYNALEGKVVWKSSQLYDPGVEIGHAATKIHGISNEDVRGMPSLVDDRDCIIERLQSADVVVAFNWPFEQSHLKNELGGLFDFVSNQVAVLDPLVVVRFDEVGRYWKGIKRHTLTEVCARMGIPWEGQEHRADSDAAMACCLLDVLKEWLPDDLDEAVALVKASRAGERHRFEQYLGASRLVVH